MGIGSRVGPYMLRKWLGKGSLGAVFLAEREGSDFQYAVKALSPDADSAVRLQFQRRGQAQAALEPHPNVLRVHSAGSSGGQAYLVMRYAPGGDLGSQIHLKGPLEAQDAARLVRDLARGLAHVHAQGTLHGDLKPSNILFDENQVPKLIDFGLAGIQEAFVPGKASDVNPAYMAPEQVAGKPSELGPWTDIYSLGAVMYEVLTGRPPFRGTVNEILAQLKTKTPLPPSSEREGVPPALEAICMRCLEKEPGERYTLAESLIEDLDAYLARARWNLQTIGLLILILLACAACFLGGYLLTRS